MHLILVFGIGCILGPVLFFGAFTSGYRSGPRFVHVGLVISGIALTAWGFLGLTLRRFPEEIASHTWFAVYTFKTFFGGMALGVLVLLLAAGGLPIRPWLKLVTRACARAKRGNRNA
jgi:hypothetical protein